MAKHTQTIRRQYADELFEYVWPFVGLVLKGLTAVNLPAHEFSIQFGSY